MKICTLCNKNFRDNYALERHQNKKKPCVNSVINKNNQSQPVVVLNNFGEEDIEHITNDIFTNLFYHKTENIRLSKFKKWKVMTKQF